MRKNLLKDISINQTILAGFALIWLVAFITLLLNRMLWGSIGITCAFFLTFWTYLNDFENLIKQDSATVVLESLILFFSVVQPFTVNAITNENYRSTLGKIESVIVSPSHECWDRNTVPRNFLENLAEACLTDPYDQLISIAQEAATSVAIPSQAGFLIDAANSGKGVPPTRCAAAYFAIEPYCDFGLTEKEKLTMRKYWDKENR